MTFHRHRRWRRERCYHSKVINVNDKNFCSRTRAVGYIAVNFRLKVSKKTIVYHLPSHLTKMKSTKERTMNFISSTEHEARLFPHKATKTTSLEKKKRQLYCKMITWHGRELFWFSYHLFVLSSKWMIKHAVKHREKSQTRMYLFVELPDSLKNTFRK